MSITTDIDLSDNTQNALVIKNTGISYISCPLCPLPAKFNIKVENNEIMLISQCQKSHNEKIKLEEYLNNQQNKNLKCLHCNQIIFPNEIKIFYCFDCQYYICYKCKAGHKKANEEHNIINLSKLGTKCYIDYKECIGYCDTCNINFCNFCKNNHKEHYICDSSNFILSYNNLNDFQKNIENANLHIENIKFSTDKIINILERKIEEIKICSDNFIRNNLLELEFSKEIFNSYNSIQNDKSCIYEVIDNALNFLNFNINKPNFDINLNEDINIENESIDFNKKFFNTIIKYLEYLKNEKNNILKTIPKTKKNFPFQQFIINNNSNIKQQNIKNSENHISNYKNNILETQLEITTKEIEKLKNIYEKFEDKKSKKDKILQFTKKILSNGIFIGEINSNSNLPHGRGILTENNGDIYQGYFLNGEKNGFGIISFYKDSSIFRGQFENDKLKFGTLSFPNGKFYRGNFIEGKFDNYGILYGGNYIYEGNFLKGKKNGFGIYKTNDGIYEGEFCNDTYSGFGKWSWNNGDSYIGDWVNGIPFGFGNLNMANGKVYSGDFSPEKENPMYCNVGGKREFSYMKIEEE